MEHRACGRTEKKINVLKGERLLFRLELLSVGGAPLGGGFSEPKEKQVSNCVEPIAWTQAPLHQPFSWSKRQKEV